MTQRLIKTLLICNRGEIACRIIRTARRMGVKTIAVFSQADRGALHTQLADQAIALTGYSAAESYLDQAQLLAAAAQCGADALHPGYGFLSENAAFAQAVVDAGYLFVGPRADAIAAMGSKARAKQLMSAAGVPMLPGYHGDNQDAAFLHTQADLMAYPVLIKAVAGGGGRGLRIVEHSHEFMAALQAVKRESKAAFADDRVLLEKYLPHARHIEIQVFADQAGHCVHLHERDCSIQRRHQKLIEEAPAPGLKTETRLAMGEAAVRAAQAIDYTGAGTVEFLYQNEQFYFLEMNTRLQVEHPVTEAITGLDLVEWQLRVAQGEDLPLTQSQIKRDGWAIEARINAEGPAPDFLPGIGLIEQLVWPPVSERALRVDAGFRAGDRISVYYDSLLGKVIAWAPSRAQAVRRLSAALACLQVAGIQHNGAYLGAVLDTQAFAAGDVHTGFLLEHQAAIAAAQEHRQWHLETRGNSAAAGVAADGFNTSGFKNSAMAAFRSGGLNPFSRQHHLLPLFAQGEASPASDADTLIAKAAASHHQSTIKAPLPGRVISVFVKAGDAVVAGQALLIMEAMKMEHTLRASSDSVIAAVHCQDDHMVQPDQLLIEFAPPASAPGA
ncbi:MAG: biotin carboxylase N-terminal domain-containing protein [Pseudohongiella sp.]|nr:biotin carboxylase N-terminal domain-containing protein [Pseudohongiella sp.]